MFDAVSGHMHADMYASFGFSESCSMSLLFAGGTDAVPGNFPIEASRQYARLFWKRDPLLRHLLSNVAEPCAIRTQASERIPSGDYRAFCYDEPGVLDRMSIFRRHGNAAVLVNFYRYRDSGRFSERDIGRVSGLSEFISALILKHLAVTSARATPGLGASAASLADRLRAREVTLSEREMAVCVAMLEGASLKEVSRNLGIRLSTAITYKKRAYDKLGVSTRFELQALFRTDGGALH
jgi:DNA-binding CsgD family transcriptional regulator